MVACARATELVWSVNHTHKRLDRAGKANAKGFKWITHEELTNLVLFELEQNNRCQASGQVWCRDLCIPMSGSFSAQSADLHSIWSAYTHRQLFRALGQLHLTTEGFPYWRGQFTTALCQFRDNIVLGADAPPEQRAALINKVRGSLQKAWGLRVVCECMNNSPQCVGACCTPTTKVMGYVPVREPKGTGIAFVEPSALTGRWGLRLGPTLLTPGDAYKGYLGSSFACVLKNGAQWTTTWISEIMSATAWLQVALLCGYRRETAMRAIHKAIHRAYVQSPHDTRATIKVVYSLSYSMSAPPCAVARRVQRWLHDHAYWEGGKYASWRLAPEYVVQGVSGDWCTDFACLDVIAQQCTASDCVCVWPPGNRVQEQTGYCRLGSSGVDVGAVSSMKGMQGTIQSSAGLGWSGLDWAGLGWA